MKNVLFLLCADPVYIGNKSSDICNTHDFEFLYMTGYTLYTCMQSCLVLEKLEIFTKNILA